MHSKSAERRLCSAASGVVSSTSEACPLPPNQRDRGVIVSFHWKADKITSTPPCLTMPLAPPKRDSTDPGAETLSMTSLSTTTSNPLSSAGRHMGSAHRNSTMGSLLAPLEEKSPSMLTVFSTTLSPSPRTVYVEGCFAKSSRAVSMSSWLWSMPITKRH